MTSHEGVTGTPRPMSGAGIDVSLLAVGKLALGLYVLRTGFSHVSDDDYARTVIAMQFAHAPKLDPSGTSWLPFPFWVVGAIMAIAGRSLAVSRAVSTLLGAVCVAAPYAAMRATGVGRVAAFAGTAVSMMLPWNAWLGVAMVPEGWTGALVGAALIATSDASARPWAAAALLVTSLSRYEAWPACGLFALFCFAHARPTRQRGIEAREVAWALVALAGPLAWIGWNAHVHGSAFHFLARVRAFRRSVGASEMPLSDKLLGYPRALLMETPEVAILGALGVLSILFDRRLRCRWGWSVTGALAMIAFLVVGDLRDGAPTHHPGRALSPIWWVFAGLGADATAAQLRRRTAPAMRSVVTAALATAALGWLVSLPVRWRTSPGRSDWDRRDPQLAAGLAMRQRGVSRAEITPCGYEHFALLAAWGQPERAQVNPSLHLPPSADCPRVVER